MYERVRVPATSANLGPGFDCLGVAVGLYLEVSATSSSKDHLIYEGEGNVPDTPDNLIHQGFRAVYAALGERAPCVRLEAHNPIPLARGLGSSSAALVAGAALADAVTGERLGRDGVFQLTADIEGHPDNVAPAVYGGFTVSARADERYLCQTLPLPNDWHFSFAVPDFELFTSEARAALPTRYVRADAIYTASRTALWTAAVALNKPELLRVAAQDVLHEPYREPLIPGLAECRKRLLAAGASAAFLSGAGPTLAAISLGEATREVRREMQTFVRGGRVLGLEPSGGYTLKEVQREKD